jgi:hypothetical protein
VPCGIAGRRPTSLERLLQCPVPADHVRERLVFHFGEVFRREMLPVTLGDLKRAVDSATLKGQRHDDASTDGELLKGSRA